MSAAPSSAYIHQKHTNEKNSDNKQTHHNFTQLFAQSKPTQFSCYLLLRVFDLNFFE
jgi:hypothetical protein